MDFLEQLTKAMAEGKAAEVLSLVEAMPKPVDRRPDLTDRELAEIRIDIVDWLSTERAFAQAVQLCIVVLENLQSESNRDYLLIAEVRDRLADLYLNNGQIAEAAETWGITVDLMTPIEGHCSDANLWRMTRRADAIEKLGDVSAAGELRKIIEARQHDRLTSVERVRSFTRRAKTHDVGHGQFEMVKVYFGTHRDRTGRGNPYDYFRGGRSSITYGSAIVSIPTSREIGTLPRLPTWMKEDRADPAKYFVIKSIDLFDKREIFFSDLRDQISGADTKEALVFVHGYNTSFASAVLRTAQLAGDLELSGAAVLYSWPSKGTILSYLMDRNEAIAPYVRDLKDLIRDLATRTGASKVHLVAHSLGGEFLLRALEELTREYTGPPPPKQFTEIIFAAPDIDAFDFTARVPQVTPLARRITVYSSSNDMALKWSEWANGTSRAGQLLFAAGVECVDTSNAQGEGFGHGEYAMSAIDDLRGIIWLSLEPSRRRTLVQRKTVEGTYWICDPNSIGVDRLFAARQAMAWARRVGIEGAADVLSKLVSGPAMNADEVKRRQVHSAILQELVMLR